MELYYIFTPLEFFTSALDDGLSWTLLSILAIFNHVVVWMVSTRPPTSTSSSPFNSPLVTVQNAPIRISIIVTFMFHSFFLVFAFCSLARSRYFSFFSLSFNFILWSAGTANSIILQVKFSFFGGGIDYYKFWSSGLHIYNFSFGQI